MIAQLKMHFYCVRLVVALFFVCGSIDGVSQCEFTIVHNNSDDHCLYAVENVVWKNVVNATADGNDLKKSSMTSNWDAGAISVNTVKDNGYATMAVAETNTDREFGLSFSPAGSPNFGRSQFGIYLWSSGKFSIYEYSQHRGNPPGENLDNTYKSGDIFKISIERGILKYYQNNTLLLVSAATPSIPMNVDVTLSTPSSTIEDVQVVNGSDGRFMALASNAGVGASFQWYENGLPVGTGPNYSNPALASPKALSCVLTTGIGGCAPAGTTISSNSIQFQTVTAKSFADYSILGNGVSVACLAATEPAVFTDLVNAQATGNVLTKVRGSSNSWDAGAFSINSVIDNGSVEAEAAQTSSSLLFGLSPTNTGVGFGSVTFAFFLRNDGVLQIYESSSLRKDLGSYNTGDKVRIEIDNGVVKYFFKGNLEYQSSVSPVVPLHLDIALSDMNGGINAVTVTNGTSGSFSAYGSRLGGSPSYQWDNTGTPVGGNTSSLTTPVADLDIVTCKIGPGLVGCAPVLTEVVSINRIPYKSEFYISATPSSIACAQVEEQVTFTDLTGVSVSGNSIEKFQGADGGWNAGATSLNVIEDNGYAKVTVNQTNTAKVFGLSSKAVAATHTSPANTTIQYGIYFRQDKQYEIWELVGAVHTFRGNFGLFDSGDEFEIRIENGTVRYYHNNVWKYSSPTAATAFLPMVVDISLNTLNNPVSARFDNVIVSNGSTGVFNANTSGGGPSPFYQWTVNGQPAGTNASNFSQSTFDDGDKITCSFRPDIPGCAAVSYTSNIVTVKIVGGASSPTTTWTGAASSAWQNSSNWSNGVPVGYYKAIVPSGTLFSPTAAASSAVYDITIAPGANFNLSNSSLTVFNNWTNQGAFSSGTGTVTFRHCTTNQNAIVTTSPETFHNITADNANGLTMTGENYVKGQFLFKDGIVRYIGAAELIFNDNAVASGAKDQSFVEGRVQKIGNDAFVFPIGKNGLYRHLQISAPGSTTEKFEAEYFFGNATQPPLSLGTAADPIFWSVSGCEYWMVDQSNGGSPVEIQLSWKLATGCANPPYITSLPDLRVSYWNGTLWANAGNGGTTGDADNGTVTSSSPISNYSTAFTLASVSSANPLPIEISDLSATLVSREVFLRWKTLSELGSKRFVIQRATSDLIFSSIDSVAAAGESRSELQYQYVDKYPLTVRSYYRLKLVDLDNSFRYSSVETVNGNEKARSEIFPNPVKKGEKAFFSNLREKVLIIDVVTQRLYATLYNSEYIDTADLKPGVYLICEDFNSTNRLVVY